MQVNLRIPTSLNEITLGQYQEFVKLEQELKDSTEVSIQLKMIEIFLKPAHLSRHRT